MTDPRPHDAETDLSAVDHYTHLKMIAQIADLALASEFGDRQGALEKISRIADAAIATTAGTTPACPRGRPNRRPPPPGSTSPTTPNTP